MKTVKEISRISGVSVRTLHHYDAIGLLKPARITESGYRLYDEASLQRLQTILLFRQLQFPLKEIRQILDDPQFDPMLALQQQIQLLQLQRQHLDDLISHALKIQKKGRFDMDFSTFDTSKLDRYAAEAKEKWGQTAAYKEHEEKTKNYSKGKWNSLAEEMDAVMAEFSLCMKSGAAPDSAEAQALAKALQDHISANYYLCTKEILAGLGQMYVADERFRANIDKHGDGTAAFIRDTIAAYCAE